MNLKPRQKVDSVSRSIVARYDPSDSEIQSSPQQARAAFGNAGTILMTLPIFSEFRERAFIPSGAIILVRPVEKS